MRGFAHNMILMREHVLLAILHALVNRCDPSLDPGSELIIRRALDRRMNYWFYGIHIIS